MIRSMSRACAAACAATLVLAVASMAGSESAAGARSYTVRRGDSLARIAARECGTARCWPKIAQANNIRKPYVIRTGQVIQLPMMEGCTMGSAPSASAAACENPGGLCCKGQTSEGYAPAMMSGSQSAPTPMAMATAYPAPTGQTITQFPAMAPQGEAVPNAYREPDKMKPAAMPEASIAQADANVRPAGGNNYFQGR
jgi:LysM repeat protein